MDTWLLIILGVLVLLIAAISAWVFFLNRSNEALNQSNVLYPFYGAIQPGQTTTSLTKADGTPQIDCSAVGGKINIVGAFIEVIDPYGQCTDNSSDVLNLTCGIPGAKIPCKLDSDCGAGMTCGGGICVPAGCGYLPDGLTPDTTNCSCGGTYCPIKPGASCPGTAGDTTCGDGTLMTCIPTKSGSTAGTCQVNPGQTCMAPDPINNKFCALYPLCSNSQNSGTVDKPKIQNKICGRGSSSGNCKPRDASAYLASKCDGQTTCPFPVFDPTQTTSGFGPMPCNSSVLSQSAIGTYTSLPNIPGQEGSYNQGYYIHGLYSCQVD